MSRRGRALWLLSVALFAAGVGVVLELTHALRPVELASVDARFALRGTQPAPENVVVVAIDQKTIDADHGTFPLNRSRDAEVIKRLTAAGAGVIAYDIPITSFSDDPDADNALYLAVQDAPRIVLGTNQIGKGGTTNIFGGGETLKELGVTAANTHLEADPDGQVRRTEVKPQQLVSFPLAAAQMLPGHTVSTPAGDDYWVDYPGPEQTVRTLSFLDIEQGRFKPEDVRGKVVVIGPTAASAADIRATSTSGSMAQPEIEAASVATALDGFPLQPASRWLNLLIAALLGVVGPLAALRFGVKGALIAGTVALLAFLIAAKFAFDGGTMLSVVPPVVAVLLGSGLGVFVAAAGERSPTDALLDRLTRGKKGNVRTRRLRASLLLSAMAFVIVSCLVLQGTGALLRIDLGTVDQRFQNRGKEPAPKSVAVVAIDDKTFDSPPNPRWPFVRTDYAKAIRHLREAGAKVIALDVQISERDKENPKADQELVDTVAAQQDVVMATTEVDEHGLPNVFFDADTLASSRATTGNSNYERDVDGRMRRLAFELDNSESFPMAAARMAAGHPIRPPGGDTAWIDYAGGPVTLKKLSFVDVRSGKFNPADVKGRVVVIGAWAPVLQDLHATSTTEETLMPGPEIHANSIATILAGFPLRSAPNWWNWLTVFLLGVITPAVALRRGILLSVLAGALAIVVFLVFAQVAFNDGKIVTIVYPLLAGIGAILLTGAIHALTVAFEREQARDAFARFVPEAVVDQVLADSDGVRLGGVRREGTVMFSDLRGFTSFSESLEPERVIEALNKYLTEMSEAILDNGGTLVAYMGDGIMAVFGAPLVQEDHADRALEAAREMLERLLGFNQWLRDQELHDGFKMGIGLNSGPVMSGNVGSERRLEYTALGDTTNTAARLEGMTKGTPHQLYVADATKQRLTRPADDLIAVGEADVRGRKAKVLLWSLDDSTSDEPAPAKPERVEA